LNLLKLTLLPLLIFVSVDNLYSQSTYYWVGGTGNWSDLTHWATTSGGSIKHTIVPSQINDVVFDANSFTASGQTVTVNQTPFCKNFVWDGVTNNPSFNCTGYNFEIFGAFRSLSGSWSFTQDNRTLAISDSLVVRSNITFNKTGGSFNVGKGVIFRNMTAASSFQATSSSLAITAGDFDLADISPSSVRFAAVTISNGSCKVNNCSPALFNWGNLNIPLGSFKVKTWNGTTFQLGTVNITQDSFLINIWNTGSFSSSNITCNAAKFHLSNWSGTTSNFSAGNISTTSTTGGIKIKNWNANNFSAGTITLAQDSFLIDNWDRGSFNCSTINCGAAKFHVKDWSGTNFICNSSISTTTGGFKIKNWNGGTFQVSGSISLAQDSFLIETWTLGSFSSGAITCNAAKFHISNWSGTSSNFTAGNISTTSTTSGIKIKNWNGNNFQAGIITLAQDSFLIDNWDRGSFSSSTINCGAAKFHIKDWSGTSFYCNSNISTSSSFKIKGWTSGSFRTDGSISANQDTLMVNSWGGTTFTTFGNINCGNARFQLSNWTAGSFSANSITANLDSVIVRNWSAGNFSTSQPISANARGVIFENWNSGNISSSFTHANADLVFKNVVATTTVTLSNTTDIRKIIFNNAPINFNGSSQSLTIRGDFDLTGSGVKYSHSGTLNIYGNTNLTGATTYTNTGTTNFLSSSAGTRINLNNYTLNNATFLTAGTWTFDNIFRVSGTTTHSAGTLVSNSYKVYLGNLYDATGSSSKTLNLTGTDTVYVGYSLRMNAGASTTLIKDMAVLKMESNVATSHIIDIPGKSLNDVIVNTLSTTTAANDVQFLGTNAVFGNVTIKNYNNFRTYFNASNATFTTVNINYPTSNANLKTIFLNATTTTGNFTISTTAGATEVVTTQNNTFGDITLPTSTTWTSTAGRTQTLTSLIQSGNCTIPAIIKSNTTSVTTISDAVGTNSFDYLQTQNVNFFGGATWQATNSLATNTTGLTLAPYASQTFYWIGNAGNWNDPIHWSLSSGGVTANCVPNPQDSIVFDVNSFSLTNQRVTVNDNITHKAITVNNVSNNPEIYSIGRTITLTNNLTFSGTASRFTHSSSTLNVQGNALVNASNVVWNNSASTTTISGDLFIKNASSGSYTFSSASLSLGDSLIIHSSTLSTFSVGSNLILTNGSINIKTSNITTFNVAGSITANNGSFLVQQGAISNFTTTSATFNKGFRIISSPSGNYTFNSANTSSVNALILSDSLVIRNSTLNTFYLRYYYSPGGYYVYHNVILTAGSVYINNSNLPNFTANNINVSNGSIKFENNSSGTFNSKFSCSSDFLIKDSPVNWNMTIFNGGTASAAGNFTITNSQCSFNTYLITLTVSGNFLIDTKTVTWTSFSTVTINGDYSVLSSASSISFTNSNTLNVRGNFTLNPLATYNVFLTNFTSTTTGKTINPAGKSFTRVNFTGNGGAWTMLNDFTCTGDVNHSFGSFISNGYKVDYGLGLNANYSNIIGLNYTGTDTIRARYYYTLSASANTILTIGNAVLKINTNNISNDISFNGNGKTFNDIFLIQSGLSFSNNINIAGTNTRYEKLYISLDRNGTVSFSNNSLYYKDVFINYKSTTAANANVNITGANTWYDLKVTSPKVILTTTISAANTFDTLSMPNATSFTFQSNVTQNWNAFISNGICDIIPVYKSSAAGTQATLNDLNGGITNLSFVNLKDIRVTGGTWNASNVIDGGNNTGINITAAASVTYYWIGGSGSWNDPNRWSLTSGGTSSSCIPSQNDDVVFDILSFSANGQSVSVTSPVTVRNMTWTSGVNRNPTFNPSTLNVTGDLVVLGQVNITSSTNATIGGDFILNQNVTWTNLTQLNFVSDSLNNVINFSGKSFNCSALFNSISAGITPQWTLTNNFTINNTTSNITTFSKGNFISNGYNVNFGRYFDASGGTAIRNLNFTGSTEVRAGYEWRVTTNVNTTLNMGASKLILDYNTPFVFINFFGGNKTYHEVEINKYYNNNNTGYHIYIYNNNTFTTLNATWKPNASDNLEIQGTQIIGTLNANIEANPYTTINLNITSNNNQINTFNVTTRGSATTNVNINGTGQNISSFNATHNGTSLLNTNFQSGTHTIGSVNINGTSSGAVTTSFSNGAHSIGNTVINSAFGNVTTNMNANNAVFGNYSSSTASNGSNNLNLSNLVTLGDVTMQSVNGTSRILSQTGNKTFNNLKITTTGTGIPDPEFYSNTTINRLELSQGFDMYIGSNANVTINNDFVASSSCTRQSRITGANQATSRITKTTGTVNINYATLQTHTVTGGASFNATNTVNTNTTGWTAMSEPPITYYWIGGTGNWNDINKWSLTSGGVSNGCKIPEPKDNVVFDQNSFTAANQFVTLNVSTTVNNMIWSGTQFNPGFGTPYHFNYALSLTVNGDLVINDQMRWTWAKGYYYIYNGIYDILNLKGSFKLNPNVTWGHDNLTYFNTSTGSHEVDLAGKSFVENVYFTGLSGSELVLENNFVVNPSFSTYFTSGKLLSNGYNVDFGRSLFANNSNAKHLNFTNSSSVTVRETWEISTNVNNVLIMGGASLNLQSNLAVNKTLRGGNKTYNNVTIQHDNTANLSIFIYDNNTFGDFEVGYVNRKDITIFGNNTFGSFTLRQNYDVTSNISLFQANGTNLFNTFVILSLGVQGPLATFSNPNTFGNFISVGRNTRIKFAANLTQTFTGPVQVLGTGGQPIFMQSTTDGTRATLFRADDNMCFDYIWIKDIIATGGATFLGGINGVDLGNNMGITFNDNCVGYYWVGGSGNWSDVNHWATASGGNNKHLIPPTQVDHVFFDANSFSGAGQTVTLDINGICANMDWLSSLFNPTFTGSADNLSIHGSLTLSPNMNITWQGDWFLKGDTEIETVDLKGKLLKNLIFDANQSTGGYNILQPISVTDTITISDGIITTNNQAISAKTFIINSANSKTLNLGSSTVIINEGGWDVLNNSAITLNAGTSTIDLKSNAEDVLFNGGNLTYNNVKFTTTTSMIGSVFGNNTYNTFTAGGSTHLTIESGKTQSASAFILGGECNDVLTIDADTPGSATTLSKSSGIVDTRFLHLTDVHASGGATFNTTLSSNNGNNTGWNFITVAPFDVTLSTTNPTCPIPINGSITANPTGGIATFSYIWSNLSATQTINNLSAGTYTCTISDDAGCVVIKTATITQPSTFGFTASATGSTVCFGTSTGTVSAAAPGGATPLTYLWNNSATTGSQMNIPAGNYLVTVTDNNGCIATASTVVNAYPQLTATYTNTTANCKDLAMTFTGSPNVGGYLYNWNFGDANTANTRIANNTYTTTGTFSVVLTVTDNNGCTDIESKQITIVNPPSVTATTVSTTTCVGCNGFVNLNISNGTAPYTIVNNTPVSNLCAGNYTYQIRDVNQCLSTPQIFAVALNDLTKPTISGLTNRTSIVNTGCTATGISLGSPTVTDDCTLPANILVSNNAPISGVYPIGVTTVVWTATDAAMNTQTFNQTVTVTAADINIAGNGLAIINGDITPSIDDNTDFGETSIGSNVTKMFSIENLGTGALNLTGSPRVNLSSTSHFSVTTQPSAASIASGGSPLNFSIRYTPTSAGMHDATVTILSNDCDEAVYSFMIKGNVNCSITIDAVGIDNETCPNANDGTLTVTATCGSCGNAADIEYSIDGTNFQLSNVFTGLPDGTYTVYVRDVNDITCTDSDAANTIEAGMDITPPLTPTLANATGECAVTITAPTTTDVCAGTITGTTTDPLTYNTQGTFTITWTFNDGNGNSTTAMQTVIVDDVTPPVTPTIANATGECAVTVTAPTTTDVCAGTITGTTTDPLTYTTQGTFTITWTFNDGNGNNTTAMQTVIVDDVTPPLTPTLANATGECAVTVTAPTTTDVCAGTITGTTTDPLTYNTQGNFTITWTFNDGNGNSTTAMQTVIVDDVTPPVTPTLANATGECAVTITAPTTTDVCAGTITGTTTDPLTYNTQGTFTITWTFNDGNGNSTTAMQTVIVDDVTPPLTPTLANATGECAITVTAPTTTDVCAGTITGTTTDPLTYNTQGTFTITWTFNDGNGNSTTAMQTVIVDDVTPPVTPTLANATGECAITVTAPTTTDVCAGTITGTTTDPLTYTTQGTFTITWTFNDGNGNSTTAMQTVIVDDVTPPLTPTLANATGECAITVTAPTTTDVCAATITGTTTDPLTYTTQGTFTITWTFNDGNGNSTTAMQTVIVDDVTPPVTPTLANATGECAITVTAPTTTDVCAGTITGTTTDPLTYTTQGTFTITWTFNDGNGNSTTAMQTVIVDDVTPPLTPTIANATGECAVTVKAPTTTDVCAGTITGTTMDPVTYNAQGTFTITWTFNDGNGNSTTAMQTVIVDDVTPPLTPTIANATGECAVTVTAPTTTDVCAGTITGTTTDPLTYTTQGTFTITWTFNDGNGNSTTAMQTVIVDDVTPPLTPTIPNATGQCDVTVTTPTTTDVCVGTITGTTTDPLTYNTQGTFTITWTFNDGNGNNTTAMQTVIVDDVTPPVTPTLANANGECAVTVTAPTTTDVCAGTITGTTTDPLTYNTQGTFTITWTFNDGNGNSTTAMQTVIVDDVTPPLTPTIANATGQCDVTVTTPTTIDVCVGTITGTTTDPLTYTTQGTFTITWTFNDGNGNSTTAMQTVIVDDVTPPLTPTIANATGQCDVTVTTPTTIDVCVGTITGTTTDPLTYTTQGTFTITWTFNDGNGNLTTALQTVIVDDVTPPVTPTIANATGQCDVTVTPPTTSDVCAGTITGTTSDPTTYTGAGTYIVKWSFDDGYGNSTTAIQNVIVNGPDLDIFGNAVEIMNGDNTPSTLDDTNMGILMNTGPVSITKTYTIQNNGNQPLSISGISSDDGEFVVSNLSSNSLAPTMTAAFDVTFTTLISGLKDAVISINSNNCNEQPFTFKVDAIFECPYPNFMFTGGSTTNPTDPTIADNWQYGCIPPSNDPDINITIMNGEVFKAVDPIMGDIINYGTLKGNLNLTGNLTNYGIFSPGN
jgi:hypothetical protein